MKIIFSLMLCLLFAGCSSPLQVMVKDEEGRPIQNAEVYAISLSITSEPHLTNKKGIAHVPLFIGQQARWISVAKEGYAGTFFDTPKTKKIEVALKQEAQ
ncbi:MAG: hypothetical protein ISS71_01800 [Phycisphaerae bacterium]|nr:hypothetical protein [Phycisphaerae bacterium]